MRKIGLLILLLCVCAAAQNPNVTVTGVIQGPNGLPVSNSVISFTPTQSFFVAGLGSTTCSGYILSIDGLSLTCGDTVNLSDSTPGAPANALNVKWQSQNAAGVDSVSAYLLGNGNVADCLSGIMTWVVCGGGGGGGGTGTQYQTAAYNPTNTLVGYGPGIAGAVSTSQGPSAMPSYSVGGVAGRTVGAGGTDSILCDSGTTVRDRLAVVFLNTGGAITETVPDAGSSGCGNNFAFALVVGSGTTATVNNTSTSTFTVFNGVSQTSVTTLSLTAGQYATFNSADNVNYIVRLVTPTGSGTVTGTGTNNKVPKWTGASSLGNSAITDNGTSVTISEAVGFSGQNAAGLTASGSAVTTTGNCGSAESYFASAGVGCANASFSDGQGHLTYTGNIEGLFGQYSDNSGVTNNHVVGAGLFGVASLNNNGATTDFTAGVAGYAVSFAGSGSPLIISGISGIGESNGGQTPGKLLGGYLQVKNTGSSTAPFGAGLFVDAPVTTSAFTELHGIYVNDVRGVTVKPGVFSGLPTCASIYEGTTAAVTDSTTNTWGATITGGSTNHVLAYCDGTNWTVAGK